MDQEMREILNEILHSQTAMSENIDLLQKDVGSMKSDISNLQIQVAKNTLLLESTRKDIQIIAEVQQSHYEQNQRAHQEILTVVDTRSSILESAFKSISSTLGEIQEDNQSFDIIIGRHTRSIETIQRKLAKTL